jgi:OmpA-OmpF porin, OOP family
MTLSTSPICRHELRLLVSALGLVFIACAAPTGAVAILSAQEDKDVKGSKDHPMISRIEGSTLQGFEQKEFDEYRLVKGPVSGYGADGTRWKDPEQALDDKNSIRLEGRVWRLTYRIPANRSTLEIIRSYETALTKAGFRPLYQCSGEECAGSLPKAAGGGSGPRPHIHAAALPDLLMKRGKFNVSGPVYRDQRYLSARLERATGDLYASVLVLNFKRPFARVDVIEVKPMQANLVTVSAATMATDIATRGSVALYGIHFDTDKTEVKPESRPTLAEIATLLKQNAALELIVVGHTDNKGTIEYNLDLSQRRAEAVVTALVSEFGVARKRLDARGVGFLAPVAPNASESDRAKNRRVQLLPR